MLDPADPCEREITQRSKPFVETPQATAAHYGNSYDTKERLASYWHQIDEVLRSGAKTVLEVGCGNGFTTTALRRAGLRVCTLDLAEDLQPDVVGSVRKIPLADSSVDIALCCQVLEHLPFSELHVGLAELVRVASRGLVISLPDQERYLRLQLRTQHRVLLNFLHTIPRRIAKRPATMDPQHYWEIGCGSVGLADVVALMREITGVSPKTYRVPENPYHRFFVLQWSR